MGDPALASPELAGIHFTGSTSTFHGMWRTMAENLPRYRGYPRIVGETGGKDFVFAHPSADVEALSTALVRGAFEAQGQKCSAASRAYVPESLWPAVKERLLALVASIKMGDPASDFRCFMGAVIDEKAFQTIKGYVDFAKASPTASILVGGGCDPTVGWFVEPTVVQVTDPRHRLMQEEIFGPVLTIHVYPDAQLEETVRLCDTTSPYALTGAVFAQDRAAVARLGIALEAPAEPVDVHIHGAWIDPCARPDAVVSALREQRSRRHKGPAATGRDGRLQSGLRYRRRTPTRSTRTGHAFQGATDKLCTGRGYAG